MLAAPPDSHKLPPLFHLSLEVLSTSGQLPGELSSHVKRVLAEAMQMADNPKTATADTLPEAIQLALELSLSLKLRALISAAHNQLSPEIARGVLDLERQLAAAP